MAKKTGVLKEEFRNGVHKDLLMEDIMVLMKKVTEKV